MERFRETQQADRLQRRQWLQMIVGLAGWSAAGLGNAVAQNKPSPEKPRITVAVSGKSELFYLPLTVAQQVGYFKAEGLDMDILDVGAVGRAQTAVQSGAADIVSGWLESTVGLQANKQYFQAFVLQCRTPQIVLGVSVRALPDYKNLQDLRGKRVGIAASGTPSHTVALGVLARAGIRPGDVQLVSVGTSGSAQGALRAGQIDALSYNDPLMTYLEQRNEVRVVADTRSLRGTTDVFGGAMPATCLYAPQDYIQKNPHTVQAVTNAMVYALKWLQTAGVSDLNRVIPEAYFDSDRALYLSAFAKMREAFSPDGVISPEGAEKMLSALYSADPQLRLEKISLERCYTNTYALKAKVRFKV